MSVVVVGKADGSVVEAVIENIRLSHPSVVRMDFGPEQVARFEQAGQDLVLVLVNGQTVVISGFFVVEDGVRSELILQDAQEVLWWGQYSQPWSDFHFAEINLVDEAAAFVPLSDGGVNWWLPLLALVGVGAAIAASGGGSDDADTPAEPQPARPVVTDSSVTGGEQGTLVIGGKTDPRFEGSKVTIVDGNGQPVIHPQTGKPVEGVVGPDGNIRIDVPEGAIPDGMVPNIVVTTPDGAISEPAPAPVERPDAPTVLIDPIVPGAGPDTELTGKITNVPEGGKPDVVVTVGGKPVPADSVTVTGPDANGDYTWTAKVPTADLPEGTPVDVVGKTSDPKTGLVSGPSQPADELVPDTTAPTVAVTVDANGNVTFQFSETPAGFDATDVTVAGATLVPDSLTQDPSDPTQWTARIVPTPGNDGVDVPVKVTVPEGSYTDVAGNPGKSGEGEQTFKAPPAPTVSIDPIVPDAGQDTELTGKITNVPEGGKPSVVVTVGGTPVPQDSIVVAGPDRNGDYTWTAKVPTADLPQGTSVDVVGKTGTPNGLVSAPSQPADERVPDTTAPTVTVTINEDGTVTFKFSEDVKGFDSADIEVAGARLAPGSLQGSGDTWTASLLDVSKGTTIQVKVKDGSYTDLADNAGAAGQDKSITIKIDSVIPTDGGGALISGRTEPGNAVTVSLPDGTLLGPVTADANGNWNVPSATHPGDAGQIQATTPNQDGNVVSDEVSLPIVTIDVVADDDVINEGEWAGLVDAGNVKLTGTSSNAQAKVVVTFNGKTYETQPDADGKWSVDVPAADVKEGGDNEITAVAKVTTPGGEVDSAIATRPFSKDTQPPAVDVKINQDGSVTFTFTEEVTGFDASSVTVANGSLSNLQQDPADPKKWTANWTADADTEGDLVITVPQGSYTDLASNPGSAGDDRTAVDTKAPTVGVTIDDQGNVTFQFSEEPDGFDATDITLTGATLVPGSLTQDQADPSKWTAKVVPVPGADGADVPVKATVPAGSYTDKAGNAGGQGEGDLTFKAPPAPGVLLDGPIAPGSGSTTPVTGKITVPAGTEPQDVFVKIGDGSPITVPAGQLEKQPDGSYTFKVDVPTTALTPGVTVDAGAKVKDPATGLVSVPGDADDVPVTQAPAVEYPTLSIIDTDGVTVRNDNGSITVKGTSTNATHVKITIGQTDHIISVNPDGTWEQTIAQLTDAEKTTDLVITATVTDGNGDPVLNAGGQPVRDTTASPAVPEAPPAPTVELDGPIVAGSGEKTPVTGKITVPAGTEPKDVFVKVGEGSPIEVPADKLEKQPDGSYTFKVDVPTAALVPGAPVTAESKAYDPQTDKVSEPGKADAVPVTEVPGAAPVLTLEVNAEAVELTKDGDFDGSLNDVINAGNWTVDGDMFDRWNNPPKNHGMIVADADGDGKTGDIYQTVSDLTADTKLELDIGWNNGWDWDGDGAPMQMVISYGGVDLLRITTSDFVQKPNSSGDILGQDATIEAFNGVTYLVNGQENVALLKTWALTHSASDARADEAWMYANNALSKFVLTLPKELLEANGGSGVLKMTVSAVGASGGKARDDFQVGALKFVKPADGLGEPTVGKEQKLLSGVSISTDSEIAAAKIQIAGYQDGDVLTLPQSEVFTARQEGGLLNITLADGKSATVADWNAYLSELSFTTSTGGARSVQMTVTDTEGRDSNMAEIPLGDGVAAPSMALFDEAIGLDGLDDLSDAAPEDQAPAFPALASLLQADVDAADIVLPGAGDAASAGTQSDGSFDYVAPANPLEDELLQAQLATV